MLPKQENQKVTCKNDQMRAIPKFHAKTGFLKPSINTSNMKRH